MKKRILRSLARFLSVLFTLIGIAALLVFPTAFGAVAVKWRLLALVLSLISLLALPIWISDVRLPHRFAFLRAILAFWIVLIAITPVGVAWIMNTPYSIHEYSFSSAGDTKISGSLYLPKGKGPFPAVIIIPGSEGSAPVTRDSTFGIYRAVADILAREQMIVLIYDKRGCGKSIGNYSDALMENHADDVVAAALSVANNKGYSVSQVGVLGISHGSWIAPLAARKCDEIKFIVIVSGPAVSEGEQRLFEWSKTLQKRNIADSEIEKLVDLRRTIWHSYANSCEDWDDVVMKWNHASGDTWFPYIQELYSEGKPAGPEYFKSHRDSREFRWHRSDMARDPLKVLAQCKAPALAVYGREDQMISVATSIELMSPALGNRGDGSKVVVVDGADHALYQQRIPPQISKRYIEELVTWIRVVTKNE